MNFVNWFVTPKKGVGSKAISLIGTLNSPVWGVFTTQPSSEVPWYVHTKVPVSEDVAPAMLGWKQMDL